MVFILVLPVPSSLLMLSNSERMGIGNCTHVGPGLIRRAIFVARFSDGHSDADMTCLAAHINARRRPKFERGSSRTGAGARVFPYRLSLESNGLGAKPVF